MIWTCPKCGCFLTMAADEFPVRCCGVLETYADAFNRLCTGQVSWVNCPYRGDEVVHIPGDALDCKNRDIRLYHCEAFGEPVSKTACRSGDRTIVAEWNATAAQYAGRTCRMCDVPGEVTALVTDRRCAG
jgi:hypothetical protein